MLRTLLDISDDLTALDEQLDALGGDVSDPEVEQAVDDWFARLGQERDRKLDNYAALIRELEARAEVRRQEARRLADRARRDEERAKYLKARLVHFFLTHGLQTVETPRFRLTLARSGGKTPVVLHAEADALPDDFRRVQYRADLDAIREALERGETFDFAELGERGHYVRIG